MVQMVRDKKFSIKNNYEKKLKIPPVPSDTARIACPIRCGIRRRLASAGDHGSVYNREPSTNVRMCFTVIRPLQFLRLGFGFALPAINQNSLSFFDASFVIEVGHTASNFLRRRAGASANPVSALRCSRCHRPQADARAPSRRRGPWFVSSRGC